MENILIENMNHTGDGIAKIDGKIIFVEKAIPGDIVNVTNVIEHKNYSQANISRIVKPSKNRIVAKCPYYNECGGCQLMSMNYEKQLIYKQEKVKNIFKKYGNIIINPKIIKSEQYNYRNKITLQVKNGKLGLFKINSHEIVEIDNCLLVTKNINKIIKIIKDKLDISLVNRIMIREVKNNIMVTFYGKINKEESIKNLKREVQSIYINLECIYGTKVICEQLEKYKFNISSNSFFQVNKKQTINLYNQILKYLGNKNKKIMDLYCGTGTISIYVSKNCKQVIGIEINSDAINNANQNKKLNNIENVQFKCGDVGKLTSKHSNYDAIIVDPPRSGLDKETRKNILNICSNKIIYVSCNPVTLIRDINALKDKYDLKDITLIDMFPNTYHVECISVLYRKKLENKNENNQKKKTTIAYK